MGDRQERMRFFLLMHPRISALVILGVAGVIAAYDSGRLADALHTVLGGAWLMAAGVGVALGAGAFAFAGAAAAAARRVGERWLRGTVIAVGVIFVLLFAVTHPRGDDAILEWSTFELVIGVDTCLVLSLAGAAFLRWRTPVPDFAHVAQARPRHGRRWKRRSAARRPDRPGGR